MVYPEWKSEYSISPGTYVKNMLGYCDMKTSIAVGFFEIKNRIMNKTDEKHIDACAELMCYSAPKLNDYIH